MPLLLAALLLGQAADAPGSWPSIPRGANIVITRTRKDDILHLARDWKADSVRLLVHTGVQKGEAPWAVDEERLAQVFETVGWCREAGLYTVIALQPPDWEGDALQAFWDDPARQAAYAEAWRRIARRYAEAGDGIALELMNEPHGPKGRTGHAAVWNRLAKDLTRVIREADPRRTIVVGGPNWSHPQEFRDLEPTGDAGTVYTFHFYQPFTLTHLRGAQGTLRASPEWMAGNSYPGPIAEYWKGAKPETWDRDRLRREMEPAIEFGRRHGARIWVGEFGCIRWAPGALAWYRDCLEIFESEKLGWSFYSYREDLWGPMDIERDPADRSRKAPRTETEIVRLFRRHFALSGK